MLIDPAGDGSPVDQAGDGSPVDPAGEVSSRPITYPRCNGFGLPDREVRKFAEHVRSLTLQRPFELVEQCMGLATMRGVLCGLGIDNKPVNGGDFDDSLRLVHSLMESPAVLEGLAFGTDADLQKMDLSLMDSADGFVAGPPCQAFAANGFQLGWHDPRSRVFTTCVEAIIRLALRGQLKIFALENSMKILTANGGAFIHTHLSSLCEKLPGWHIDIVCADPRQSMTPLCRSRAWIRGIRKDLSATMPIPLHFGHRRPDIYLYLDESEPNIKPSALTTAIAPGLGRPQPSPHDARPQPSPRDAAR